MSVASHLGIELSEYDARIRTFIPAYEEMLAAAADVVPPSARRIVDLGTGTGALAARCLRRAPNARVIGIDADPAILALAARRLGSRGEFVTGSFLRLPIPACDVAVASLALHHIRTRGAKRSLYTRIRRALARRGCLVLADCQPAGRAALARAQRDAWIRHLRRSYSPRRASALLRAWADEDVYVPLDEEMAMMTRAGFDVEVVWRKGAFAVLRGAPRQ
jgi:tRNA (cmo5U34)-methyltransferase